MKVKSHRNLTGQDASFSPYFYLFIIIHDLTSGDLAILCFLPPDPVPCPSIRVQRCYRAERLPSQMIFGECRCWLPRAPQSRQQSSFTLACHHVTLGISLTLISDGRYDLLPATFVILSGGDDGQLKDEEPLPQCLR